MLKELTLSNFRIFDDPVTIRFRPITILIGRNSSGKSSIVKFLLMLQQSTERGNSLYLTPEGSKTNLGPFRELRNFSTRKRDLKFDFKVEVEADVDDADNQLFSGQLDAHDVNHDELVCAVQATIPYAQQKQTGKVAYVVANDVSGTRYLDFPVTIGDNSTFLGDSMNPPFPGTLTNNGTNDVEHHNEDSPEEIPSLFRYWLGMELQDGIRHQINAIRHLPPVRAEAQRVIIASHPPSDHVGSKGEYALPHLQTMITQQDERYAFLLSYLMNVTEISEVRFETVGHVSQAIAKNRTTGAEALIADYGFGVSQCIPVLVQGAIMSPDTILMVEQPEAQLHPTAQLELGSYFASLWTQRKVGSIIETHSDNILLRIRRLIARGDLNSRDVSVAFFTVDEQNGDMPIVKNLDIGEDGAMEAGLPMEFFGADILEGLQLGAGQ